MASVDLEELIPDLIVELNIPGGEQYSTVSTEEWTSRLRTAFWNAHLDGLMQGWTESEGIVSKLNNPSAPAMTRDQQQIIIIYAVLGAIKNYMLQVETVARYKAGPVEYETQRSAQVYRSLLDDLKDRLQRILDRLADNGTARGIYYIDTYAARQFAIAEGSISWVGSL